MGDHQPDAPPWPRCPRVGVVGAGAARALESDYPGGRVAQQRDHRTCVFDGAINGERFLAYVEQILAPTLQPDDIVLLDNLSSHKLVGVRAAIAAQGAQLLYLPPCSPDLNPIEQAFAKFKAALRQAAPRTRDGLWQAIGRTLDLYPPQECRNFFNNAGYAT